MPTKEAQWLVGPTHEIDASPFEWVEKHLDANVVSDVADCRSSGRNAGEKKWVAHEQRSGYGCAPFHAKGRKP